LYKERDEVKRAEFIAEIEALPEDSELYYVDESGFDECYAREYGYAPRGKKVIGEISGKKFERTSIVAAKKDKEIFAPSWGPHPTKSGRGKDEPRSVRIFAL
jgi:hypothetical protein